MINTIKLIIINDENLRYSLEIPVFEEKDIFSWKLSNYLKWNKNKGNINYLLVFNHR